MNAPGTLAAVDVGSTKTVCFVARADDAGGLRVVGIGCHASRGIRAGTVADMEAAEQSIVQVVNAAEEMAGETLRRAWINVSGDQTESRSVAVEVAIDGHEVGDADLRRILQQSRRRIEAPDRVVIHALPVGYGIDGTRGIRDPRGMVGERLGVNVHLVSVAGTPLANIESCVSRCHLDVAGRVCAPLASALAVLVRDEMDLGVTVLDLGGGTTSVAVFFDGDCVHVDAVPVGGRQVTNDIAKVLSTPAHTAERLKTLYGGVAGCEADQREMIDVPLIGETESAGAHQVPRSTLTGIVRPRVESTLDMMRQRLADAGLDRIGGQRLVLTGGGAQLHGVAELAAGMFGKQVRVGRPLWLKGLAQATSGPAFATCAGLLRHAAAGREQNGFDLADWHATDGFLGRVGQWLRDNL